MARAHELEEGFQPINKLVGVVRAEHLSNVKSLEFRPIFAR